MRRTPENPSRIARRRLLFWRLNLLLTVVLGLWPVASQATKLLFLISLAITLFGGYRAAAGFPRVRMASLIGSTGILIFLMLPGRPVSQDALQARYIQELQEYQGVRYVWGGENSLGIDCSGLVRKAMIHALWKTGIHTANPTAWRAALSLWWHDASAHMLREGHLGNTRNLGSARNIQSLDSSQLHPGDLAVTSDGVHILAYLGDGRWIEADPSLNRVVVLDQAAPDAWLQIPVDLLRWRWLE